MKYDILKINTATTELIINANKLTGLKSNNIEKSGARVFKNGKIFSSAFVGTIADEALLTKAESAGNVGLDYDYDLPTTKDLQSLHPSNNSGTNGVQLFTEFFSDLRKEFPNLNWSGKANFSISQTRFSSNYTGTLQSSGDSLEWNLLYKRFGIADFADGYVAFNGTHFDFKKVLNTYGDLLKVVDQKASLSSQKMPVLLVEPSDIADRLSQDLRPDRYHNGSSFLSKKLGEQIFSPQVNLKDISYSPANGKFDRFDGEGVLHHNPTIFENGTFTNVLYDLRQAKKAGVQSSGNGKRDFNTGASFGLFGLSFVPGKDDMWDMLKSVPECLVVTMGYGGGISDQWEYSSPVQVGYLFRNGQAIGRVPGVTIKGELKDILGKDLLGVSSNGLGESLNPAVLTQMDVIAH